MSAPNRRTSRARIAWQSAATLCALLLASGLTVAVAPAASQTSADPIGAFDVLRVQGNGHAIDGWAADPDAPGTPVVIHVYVNGARRTFGTIAEPWEVTTGVYRPDVAARHPWAGDHAGFHHVLALDAHSTVCLYAINQGAGTQNTTLGCLTVDPTSSPSDPKGSLDEVAEVAPGLVRVRGWAGDPDASGPMTIHVGLVEAPGFYNPTGVSPYAQTYTGRLRPDVERLYPAFGDSTGFDAPFALVVPGTHRVCVWAINQGPGMNNTTLGCRDVVVSGGAPSPIRGRLDATLFDSTEVGGHYIPGTTRLVGWAFDPRHSDQRLSIRVIFLGSAPSPYERPELRELVGSTGVRRDDVAAAIPGAGVDTGFVIHVGDIRTTGTRFPRSFFAVYAVDPDGGPDVLLAYAS
jgi:hypothetical protein